MFKIFISYNRSSEAIVNKITNGIELQGHSVWFDKHLSGGEDWWNEILRQIRICDVFVYILTTDALQSVACKREFAYAIDLGKSILPVKVQDVAISLLSPTLSKLQFVDYRVQNSDTSFKLAGALASVPSSPSVPVVLPTPPALPKNYFTEISESIGSEHPLSLSMQRELVADLRRNLRSQEPDEARVLLQRLRERDDLYYQVSLELEKLLGSGRADQILRITVFVAAAIILSILGFFLYKPQPSTEEILNQLDTLGVGIWPSHEGITIQYPENASYSETLTTLPLLGKIKNIKTLNLHGTLVSDASNLGTLKNLEVLHLSGTPVSDVSSLGKLSNLTKLVLSGTPVSDISALGTLTKLTELHLYSTKVSDIGFLGTLKNLEVLHLGNTQVGDVGALSELSNLTKLSLYSTQISDISALGALSNLTQLDLHDTRVSDISTLEAMSNLTQLDLNDTRISDISALGALNNLTELDLDRTQVVDVSALGTLKKLSKLSLNQTKVSDIRPLDTLTNLSELSLYKTQVSEEQLKKIADEFRSRGQKVRISYTSSD